MNVEALALAAVNEYHADQKAWELAQLGHVILSTGIKHPKLVEVGTFRGGTAWFFAEIGCDVTTIDTNPGRRDVEHRRVTYAAGDSVELLGRWDKHSAAIAFIDGAHSYAGVAADWNQALWCVRPGGLVAFHDIVEHDPRSGCQVDRLWHEIKRTWPTIEIIDPAFTASATPWAGIGVVRV